MTILEKNTITLPNAQETYPNLVESVNGGLSHYTIPLTIMVISVILYTAGIIFLIKANRAEKRDLPRSQKLISIFFELIPLLLFAVMLITVILTNKVEKDKTLIAEHVSQHSETEDKVTELANTTGFDYKDVCDTIMDNRESSLCGGELFESINWGDNDDIYSIEPDYDYNDTEDELIVTFNLKEVTEEQS